MTRYNYEATRGARQESRILAALTSGPMTTRQIAESLHLSISNTSIYLARLRKDRIYIAGFILPPKGREAPLFALGQLPDVVYPHIGGRKPKRSVPRYEAQAARAVAAMSVKPMTAAQLGAALSLTTSGAREYIRALHQSTPKQAYIKDWQHPGKRGDWAPIYALGSHPDKQKPKPTRADRYAADKKDKDKYERLLADRRKLHMLARARKTPQTPFSALFAGVRVPTMNAEG